MRALSLSTPQWIFCICYTRSEKSCLRIFYRSYYPKYLHEFDTEISGCNVTPIFGGRRGCNEAVMITLDRKKGSGKTEKKMRRKNNSCKEKSGEGGGMHFQIARGAPERCLMMTHGKTNCGSNGLRPQLAVHRVLLLPCCVKLQWCGKTPEEGASLYFPLKCILVFQALNVHENVKRMLKTSTTADRETVKRMDRGAGTQNYRRTSRLAVSQRGKYKQRDKTTEPQMAGWMDGWRAEWGMWKWWINWWMWEKMD